MKLLQWRRKHVGNVHITIFRSAKDVVYVDFRLERRTINAAYYSKVVCKLKEVYRSKRRKIPIRCILIFHDTLGRTLLLLHNPNWKNGTGQLWNILSPYTQGVDLVFTPHSLAWDALVKSIRSVAFPFRYPDCSSGTRSRTPFWNILWLVQETWALLGRLTGYCYFINWFLFLQKKANIKFDLI